MDDFDNQAIEIAEICLKPRGHPFIKINANIYSKGQESTGSILTLTNPEKDSGYVFQGEYGIRLTDNLLEVGVVHFSEITRPQFDVLIERGFPGFLNQEGFYLKSLDLLTEHPEIGIWIKREGEIDDCKPQVKTGDLSKILPLMTNYNDLVEYCNKHDIDFNTELKD